VKRSFDVVIEKDEDGMFVVTVPELRGCVTQGRTMDEAKRHAVEAIELYLEASAALPATVPGSRFIGIERVEVSA
jgi:predicted RNase H-like HicB family nuclease